MYETHIIWPSICRSGVMELQPKGTIILFISRGNGQFRDCGGNRNAPRKPSGLVKRTDKVYYNMICSVQDSNLGSERRFDLHARTLAIQSTLATRVGSYNAHCEIRSGALKMPLYYRLEEHLLIKPELVGCLVKVTKLVLF